jgi:hypothetical protein
MGPSLEHCMSPVAAVGARTIGRSKKNVRAPAMAAMFVMIFSLEFRSTS